MICVFDGCSLMLLVSPLSSLSSTRLSLSLQPTARVVNYTCEILINCKSEESDDVCMLLLEFMISEEVYGGAHTFTFLIDFGEEEREQMCSCSPISFGTRREIALARCVRVSLTVIGDLRGDKLCF
jgi:hypothetical protein